MEPAPANHAARLWGSVGVEKIYGRFGPGSRQKTLHQTGRDVGPCQLGLVDTVRPNFVEKRDRPHHTYTAWVVFAFRFGHSRPYEAVHRFEHFWDEL